MWLSLFVAHLFAYSQWDITKTLMSALIDHKFCEADPNTASQRLLTIENTAKQCDIDTQGVRKRNRLNLPYELMMDLIFQQAAFVQHEDSECDITRLEMMLSPEAKPARDQWRKRVNKVLDRVQEMDQKITDLKKQIVRGTSGRQGPAQQTEASRALKELTRLATERALALLSEPWLSSEVAQEWLQGKIGSHNTRVINDADVYALFHRIRQESERNSAEWRRLRTKKTPNGDPCPPDGQGCVVTYNLDHKLKSELFLNGGVDLVFGDAMVNDMFHSSDKYKANFLKDPEVRDWYSCFEVLHGEVSKKYDLAEEGSKLLMILLSTPRSLPQKVLETAVKAGLIPKPTLLRAAGQGVALNMGMQAIPAYKACLHPQPNKLLKKRSCAAKAAEVFYGQPYLAFETRPDGRVYWKESVGDEESNRLEYSKCRTEVIFALMPI